MDIRYVAGLFDGEGWVRSDDFQPKNRDFPRYQVIAGIGMTHKPIIEDLVAEFGGCFSSYAGYKVRHPTARTVWKWTVASRIAYRFLIRVQEHVVVKRDQVDLAIQLQEDVFTHNSAMRHMPHVLKCEIFERRRLVHDELRRMKTVEFL